MVNAEPSASDREIRKAVIPVIALAGFFGVTTDTVLRRYEVCLY